MNGNGLLGLRGVAYHILAMKPGWPSDVGFLCEMDVGFSWLNITKASAFCSIVFLTMKLDSNVKATS